LIDFCSISDLVYGQYVIVHVKGNTGGLLGMVILFSFA